MHKIPDAEKFMNNKHNVQQEQQCVCVCGSVWESVFAHPSLCVCVCVSMLCLLLAWLICLTIYFSAGRFRKEAAASTQQQGHNLACSSFCSYSCSGSTACLCAFCMRCGSLWLLVSSCCMCVYLCEFA